MKITGVDDDEPLLLWQIRWLLYYYIIARIWWTTYYDYPDPPVLADGTVVPWHSDRP